MIPVGILLAAGMGTRFDPTGKRDKLLAPLPRATVLAHADSSCDAGGVAAHAAACMRGTLPRVIAVIRPGRDALRAVLGAAGCEIFETPEASRGMGAALAAAIRATPSAGGWVVGLADMPWVRAATIAAVAQALARPDSIAAPVYQGRRGHPVAFGPAHRAALSALDGDIGARDLLRTLPVTWLDVQDAGVLADVDTPGDLGQ